MSKNKLLGRLSRMLSGYPMIHSAHRLVQIGAYVGDVDCPDEDEVRQAVDSSGGIHPELSYTTSDGIAVINISGTLLNDGTDFYPGSYVTYGALSLAVQAMLASYHRGQVSVGILNIESGGGAASGCFEFCEELKEAAKLMPIHASIGAAAYSGAYAIAACCTQVWGSVTSGSGSVGVVYVHASYEKLLDDQGVEVTLLHAGARKVDMNPYKALSQEALDSEGEKLEHLYSLFASHVADCRFGGDDTPVRATEANTFIGTQGLDVGFIDRVGTFAEVVKTIREDRGKDPSESDEDLAGASAGASGEEAELSSSGETEAPEELSAEYLKAVTEELEGLGMTEQLYFVTSNRIAVSQISEQIGYVKEIEAMCETLGCPEKSKDLVQRKISIPQAQYEILQASVNTEVELSTALPEEEFSGSTSAADGSPAEEVSAIVDGTIDANVIYARRRNQ